MAPWGEQRHRCQREYVAGRSGATEHVTRMHTNDVYLEHTKTWLTRVLETQVMRHQVSPV